MERTSDVHSCTSFGDRNVRHGPARNRRFNGLINYVDDMRGTIDAFVVRRHIDEGLIQVDILLVMGSD